MGPDERTFCEHLEMGPFQSGVERGRWRLVSLEWPHSIIAVSARPLENVPSEFYFRFELSNYPQSPPTAMLWDMEKQCLLEEGKRPYGKNRVGIAFRVDWNKGEILYLPCDRLAIASHHDWQTKHPSMLWSPTKDITQYLRILHELLNSFDYVGLRGFSISG